MTRTITFLPNNRPREPINPRGVIERHEIQHEELESKYKEKIAKDRKKRLDKVKGYVMIVFIILSLSQFLAILEYYLIWRRP